MYLYDEAVCLVGLASLQAAIENRAQVLLLRDIGDRLLLDAAAGDWERDEQCAFDVYRLVGYSLPAPPHKE